MSWFIPVFNLIHLNKRDPKLIYRMWRLGFLCLTNIFYTWDLITQLWRRGVRLRWQRSSFLPVTEDSRIFPPTENWWWFWARDVSYMFPGPCIGWSSWSVTPLTRPRIGEFFWCEVVRRLPSYNWCNSASHSCWGSHGWCYGSISGSLTNADSNLRFHLLSFANDLKIREILQALGP